ncbi:MAG TPA: P-loop NTPase fold protein, partial [Verrucomicrobiae bacterium]|nr:P-loop NTPase fold protein [Verrucomicrobiae bacterium]
MIDTSTTSTSATPDSIAANTVGDQPTAEDTLGFRPYVKAISEFLKADNTHPPLTLSIEGQWGSGKSSFMMQLQNELQGPTVREAFLSTLSNESGTNTRKIWRALMGIWRRPSNLTVQYNPWRQDKEDAVWATFALSVNKQLRNKCGFSRLLLG